MTFNFCCPILPARYAMHANVGPSSVRPLSVLWLYLENWAKQTHCYYGTLLGSWRRWFCCRIQNLRCGNTVVSNNNTASCSTWRQITVAVNRDRPSSCRRCYQLLKTECDRRNLSSTRRPLRWQYLDHTLVWRRSRTRPASFLSQWRCPCSTCCNQISPITVIPFDWVL